MEVIVISQLTETLLKNLDSMAERIQSNTENVTREIYMFVPLVSLRESYGIEVIELAKKVRDADIGVRVTMTRNKDLDMNPIEGLDVLLYVDKNTDLVKLQEIIQGD